MRLLVPTNVLIALGIMLVGSVAAADDCKQTCKESGVREDTISSCRADRTKLPPLDDCVTSANDLRRECSRRSRNAFVGCRDGQCQGIAQNSPGRCTLTVECVTGCLEFRNSNLARCNREFSLKQVCTAKCVRQGDLALKACVRECRHGQPILKPATSTTLAPPATPASTPLVNDCNCQNLCAQAIVGDCFKECDDRCGRSRDGLRLCKNACRNAKCDLLQAKCTAPELPGTNVNAVYSLCCQRCGNDNCRGEFECVVTTTSTSLTTTSMTAVTTTSTSLTTTTTLVGF